MQHHLRQLVSHTLTSCAPPLPSRPSPPPTCAGPQSLPGQPPRGAPPGRACPGGATQTPAQGATHLTGVGDKIRWGRCQVQLPWGSTCKGLGWYAACTLQWVVCQVHSQYRHLANPGVSLIPCMANANWIVPCCRLHTPSGASDPAEHAKTAAAPPSSSPFPQTPPTFPPPHPPPHLPHPHTWGSQ